MSILPLKPFSSSSTFSSSSSITTTTSSNYSTDAETDTLFLLKNNNQKPKLKPLTKPPPSKPSKQQQLKNLSSSSSIYIPKIKKKREILIIIKKIGVKYLCFMSICFLIFFFVWIMFFIFFMSRLKINYENALPDSPTQTERDFIIEIYSRKKNKVVIKAFMKWDWDEQENNNKRLVIDQKEKMIVNMYKAFDDISHMAMGGDILPEFFCLGYCFKNVRKKKRRYGPWKDEDDWDIIKYIEINLNAFDEGSAIAAFKMYFQHDCEVIRDVVCEELSPVGYYESLWNFTSTAPGYPDYP